MLPHKFRIIENNPTRLQLMKTPLTIFLFAFPALLIAQSTGDVPDETTNGFTRFIEKLDAHLDANFAATLTGLSLAAFSFIFSALGPKEQYVQSLQNMGKAIQPDALQSEEKKLARLKSSFTELKYSTFCFTGLLVETLALDPWKEAHELTGSLEYVDLGLSATLVAGGLWYMSRAILRLADSV